MNRAYNHYFFHYTPDAAPGGEHRATSTSSKRPEDLDDLLKQIRGMGKGTQYYVPRA